MPTSKTITPARVTCSADRRPAQRVASEVLWDRKIDVEGKSFFVDVIKNDYGKGIRITERTAHNRQRIVFPQAYLKDIVAVLSDAIRTLGEPEPEPEPTSGD